MSSGHKSARQAQYEADLSKRTTEAGGQQIWPNRPGGGGDGSAAAGRRVL
jgi:hypothetical protein